MRTEVRSGVLEFEREHARRMARELIRYNLRPDTTVHASWLPDGWPAPHRRAQHFGAAGGEVLAALLLRDLPASPGGFDAEFTSTRKRIALLDGSALRRLAWYCGLALHRDALLGPRDRRLRRELQRQARRFGPEGADYALHRLPDLPGLHADCAALSARPTRAARIVWSRGARTLLALEGASVPTLARMRLKLPRRLAVDALPRLNATQQQRIEELVSLSIVPERLPSWDWLF